MPFLDFKMIDTFMNKIIHYIKINARKEDKIMNTLKTNIGPFVNLLARIDNYSKSYQILTKFNVELNKQFIDERSENVVSEEDLEKLTNLKEKWDYANIKQTNE